MGLGILPLIFIELPANSIEWMEWSAIGAQICELFFGSSGESGFSVTVWETTSVVSSLEYVQNAHMVRADIVGRAAFRAISEVRCPFRYSVLGLRRGRAVYKFSSWILCLV